jgi:hypothetical protein
MATLTFEPNSKHRIKKHGRVSAQPTDGQAALDDSVRISEASSRRVGVDRKNKEIVVFMEHLPGVFHGFVIEWHELERNVQRRLQKLGLVTSRGRILDESDEIRTDRTNR